ncbi:MAG: O-antigen ligase family protein, partial [Bacteroidales bacterium]
MERIERYRIHFKINYYLLLLSMATLPFTRFLMLPVAILMLVNFLIEGNYKNKWNRLKPDHQKLFFIIFSSFFALSFLGFFYSHNIKVAMADLETKIWFLTAPLVILTLDKKLFTKEKIDKLFYVFCFSCLLVALANILISVIHYFHFHDINYLFYRQASHFFAPHPMHPSYMAMYVTTAFVFAFLSLFIYRDCKNKIVKFGLRIMLLIFPLYVFFLQSKAGLLAFALCFFVLILYTINNHKRHVWLSVLFVVLFLIIPVFFLHFVKLPVNRIQSAIENLHSHNESNPTNGTTQRIAIWKSGWYLAVDHLPCGVGTGDVKDTLMKEYEQKGYTYIRQLELNLHNQ